MESDLIFLFDNRKTVYEPQISLRPHPDGVAYVCKYSIYRIVKSSIGSNGTSTVRPYAHGCITLHRMLYYGALLLQEKISHIHTTELHMAAQILCAAL